MIKTSSTLSLDFGTCAMQPSLDPFVALKQFWKEFMKTNLT